MFKEQLVETHATQYLSASQRIRSLISVLLFTAGMFHGLSPDGSAQTMITGVQIRNPLTPVPVLPSTCTPYSVYFLTTTQSPYICSTINTLTPLSTGANGSSGLPSLPGNPGYLYTDGTNVSWGNITAGGSGVLDCSTTPGQCDIVTSMIPLLSAANTWTGANNFLGASVTAPNRSGAGAPSGRDQCTNPGETYFQSDATAGSNIWACTTAGSPGTWTLEGGGSSAGPGANTFTGTQTAPTMNATTALEINGNAIYGVYSSGNNLMSNGCTSLGGGNNVILGVASGGLPCTATYYDVTAIGYQALANEGFYGGFYNTAIGAAAMYSELGGTHNTAVGNNAGGSIQHNNSNCTYIGDTADAAVTGLSNCTALGAGAIVPASNAVSLGNSSVVRLLIGGKCSIYIGTEAPNGSQVGSPCDLYLNTSGGSSATLYVKESGSATNSGWVGK